jgi:hypothetical protein
MPIGLNFILQLFAVDCCEFFPCGAVPLIVAKFSLQSLFAKRHLPSLPAVVLVSPITSQTNSKGPILFEEGMFCILRPQIRGRSSFRETSLIVLHFS